MSYKRGFFNSLVLVVALLFGNVYADELNDALTLLNQTKYTEAFPKLLALAKGGNPKAQGSLARMFGNGWGTNKDEQEAYTWASKGVTQDDPTSQTVIGYLNLYGRAGLKQNTATAIKWYLLAARQDHLPAIEKLSSIYVDSGEYEIAIGWLEKGFALGSDSAAGTLAWLYHNHVANEERHLKEIEWLKRGSKRGDGFSSYLLGLMYKHGLDDVKIDGDQALIYFELGAQKNIPGGLYEAGIYYLDGPEKNIDKGLEYLVRAESLESTAAKYALAEMYLQGLPGVTADLNQAHKRIAELKAINDYRGYELEAYTHYMGIGRPRNLQKTIFSLVQAVQLQLKDSANPKVSWAADWLAKIGLVYLPKHYAYAWKRFGTVEIVESEIEKKDEQRVADLSEIRSVDDRRFAEHASHQELIDKTLLFLEKRREDIGPIEADDLIQEGWHQFIGKNGLINEPLAQHLTEEGLRVAIRVNNKIAMDTARNNLGAILDGAANSAVRNHRLAKVHLYDGKDSQWGPDNLLWTSYKGLVHLSDEEITLLTERFVETNGVTHPTKNLLPIPLGIKNDPKERAQFIADQYAPGNIELARGIAAVYEDMEIPAPNFENALRWYKEGKYEERIKRMELVLQGKFVKDMPNFFGTITSIFDVDLVQKSNERLNDRSVVSPSTGEPINNASRKTKANLNLFALVIGNSTYGSKPLKNSTSDSKAIAAKLRTLGFNVTEVKNLDRKGFRDSIIAFSELAKDSDLTIFFYAGHGVQVGGVNYLLPTDVNFSASQDLVTYDGISLNDLKNRNLPGATRLIFLDACRTNPFKSNARGEADAGLAPINIGTGTLISYATRDGSVAYDDVGGDHSPYTQALLKHFDSNEDVALMLRAVRDEVKRLTGNKQEPWEYGALSGDKVILSRLLK